MKPEKIKEWLFSLDFVTERTKKAIKDFDRHLNARNMANNTRLNYLYGIFYTLREIKKPLEDITLQNMEDHIIRNRNYVSFSTLKMRKSAMRLVLKHMGRGDILSDLKFRISRREKEQKAKKLDNIITRPVLKKLLNNTADNRERVMLLFLFMSGCRVGELCNMKIEDVSFTRNNEAKAFLSGKTDSRWIPIKDKGLVEDLRRYINNHPVRSDNKSHLWFSYCNRNRYGKLNEQSVRDMLHRTQKRAKVTQNIHPHCIRHSRASELGPFMTDRQMMRYFGWSSPAMCSVYVNQESVDVENSIAAADGGIIIEKPKHHLSKTYTICFRCRSKVAWGLAICPECGIGFSLKDVEDEKSIAIGDAVIELAKKDNKLADALDQALKKRGFIEREAQL